MTENPCLGFSVFLDFLLHKNEIATFIARPLNHPILGNLVENAVVHNRNFKSCKEILGGEVPKLI